MVEGVREPAIAAGLIDAERFDAGVRDLYRTAEADGVFCYTFFKAVGPVERDLDGGTPDALVSRAPRPPPAFAPAQPHPHRRPGAAQVAPPGLALRRARSDHDLRRPARGTASGSNSGGRSCGP